MSRSPSLSRGSSARGSSKTLPMMPPADGLDDEAPELVSSGRLLHLFDDTPDDLDASPPAEDYSDLALDVEHVHLFED